MRIIPFQLNSINQITISAEGVVKIIDADGTVLTTADWSDTDGCQEGYGASLTARTWEAIDAAIRAPIEVDDPPPRNTETATLVAWLLAPDTYHGPGALRACELVEWLRDGAPLSKSTARSSLITRTRARAVLERVLEALGKRDRTDDIAETSHALLGALAAWGGVE